MISTTMLGSGEAYGLSNNGTGSTIAVSNIQLTVSGPPPSALITGDNQAGITFSGSNTCTLNGSVIACP
jgi:hypothetical protein